MTSRVPSVGVHLAARPSPFAANAQAALPSRKRRLCASCARRPGLPDPQARLATRQNAPPTRTPRAAPTCFTPAWYHGHGFPTIRDFARHTSLHTAPKRAQTWPWDPLDGWYSLKLNSTSFRCTRYPPRAPRAPSRMGHASTLSKGRRASTATATPGIGAPLRLLQNL